MTIWICFHLKLFWTQNFSNFKWILHLYLIELNDPKVWAWWGWLVRKTTESIKMVFLNDLGTYQRDRRKLQMVCLTSDILPYSISNVLKPEHSWGPGRSFQTCCVSGHSRDLGAGEPRTWPFKTMNVSGWPPLGISILGWYDDQGWSFGNTGFTDLIFLFQNFNLFIKKL